MTDQSKQKMQDIQPHFNLYRTKDCSYCEATLAMLHVPNVSIIWVDDNADMRTYLKSLGFSSFPCVIVTDEVGTQLDAWAGFQIKKIQKWNGIVNG